MTLKLKFNERKATEAATLLLSFKEGKKADYLWLIKMLYFIDREAINRWERPITADFYVSMNNGPVLSTVYDIIKKNIHATFWKAYIITMPKDHQVVLRSLPAPKKLAQAELDLIKELYEKYGQYESYELVDLSHKLPEWHFPKGKAIPIEFEEILSALDFSKGDISRIKAELEEEKELDRLIGV